MQKYSRKIAMTDSRFITPFFPSLCHYATIRLAVPLFKKFGRETLDRVFDEIQDESSNASGDVTEGNSDVISRRAKSILLLIDKSSRRKVMKAIRGLHRAINYWRFDHWDILKI
ncbi:unnamed protein product, partial [Larinioides sclopetarius]